MDKLKATATTFLDKRRAKKDGTYPVKLNIYYAGDKELYKTNIDLNIEEWQKMNSDKLRDDRLKIIKRKLQAIVEKAETTIKGLEPFSFKSFEESFFNKDIDRSDLSLKKHFESYLNKLYAERRDGTADSYKTAMNAILSFAPKCLITDVTKKFLEDFEKSRKAIGNSSSTIGIYLEDYEQ